MQIYVFLPNHECNITSLTIHLISYMTLLVFLNLLYLLSAQRLDLVYQFHGLIQLSDIIPTTYAFPGNQDVGNSLSASHLRKLALQKSAFWMFIKLDDEWSRYNGILIKEDVLRSFGVWTVGLGEYDNFSGPICQPWSTF